MLFPSILLCLILAVCLVGCDARIITNTTVRLPLGSTKIYDMMAVNGFLVVGSPAGYLTAVIQSYEVSQANGFRLVNQSLVTNTADLRFLPISSSSFMVLLSSGFEIVSISDNTGQLNVTNRFYFPSGITPSFVPQIGSGTFWTTAHNASVFSFDVLSGIWTEETQYFMQPSNYYYTIFYLTIYVSWFFLSLNLLNFFFPN